MLGEHHRECSVAGCGREGRRLDFRLTSDDGRVLKVKDGGKILCEPHHRRLVKYGDPAKGPAIKMGHPAINEGKSCRCCPEPVWSRGLCRNHYYRAYRLKKKLNISIEAAIEQIVASANSESEHKKSA